jgi:hypothetical protein
VVDGAGEIVDAAISYPCDFASQMLRYSRDYSIRLATAVAATDDPHA